MRLSVGLIITNTMGKGIDKMDPATGAAIVFAVIVAGAWIYWIFKTP
jgi:hypothetical protein